MKFFTSGDLPIESLISDQNTLRELDYTTSAALWAGNIDAPEYVAAGGHTNLPIDGSFVPAPLSSARERVFSRRDATMAS